VLCPANIINSTFKEACRQDKINEASRRKIKPRVEVNPRRFMLVTRPNQRGVQTLALPAAPAWGTRSIAQKLSWAKWPSLTDVGALLLVAGYLLPKSTVLLTPLLLAHGLSVQRYGAIEYAIAWATPLTMLLTFGMGGAMPYFLIRRRRAGFNHIFQLHALMLVGLTGITDLLTIVVPVRVTDYLIIAVAIVAAVQTISSTYYKINTAPVLASLFESGIYVALLPPALIIALMKRDWSLAPIILALNFYALVLAASYLYTRPKLLPWRNTARRYRIAGRFGFSLILNSIALSFLVSGGRVLVGEFLSTEAVGVYGFFFRASATVIVVYQAVSTIFFRRAYEAQPSGLDAYCSLLFALMFGVSLGALLLGCALLPGFFPKYWYHQTNTVELYLVLATQTVVWCGSASLEWVLYREELAARATTALVAVLAGLVAFTVILKHEHQLTLLTICQLHLAATFLAVLCQLFLLWHKGVRLPKAASAATAIMIAYASVAVAPEIARII
jgi:O-antigen/teichoic acid export membrane protein